MAQSLRSQVYEQMNRDVQNTIGSINSSLNSLAQLKQSYDYSFQKQVELEAKTANNERKNKIILSNNPEDWDAADEEYFAHMSDYLDQINAPQTVRNKWNNETASLQRSEFQSERVIDEARLYSNDAVTKWNAFVRTVGSNGDLDYEGKKQELLNYWKEAGLENLPKSLVGDITTVDQALEAMEGSIAVQYVDRYYSNLPNGITPADFNPSSLAEEAVADLERQLGKTLDSSTRYTYLEAVRSQINSHEKKSMEDAATQQSQFAYEYQQYIKENGEMSDSDIFALASEHGAVVDGELNKYWGSWFANNLNILTAMADLEKVKEASNKDVNKEWKAMLSESGASRGEIRAELKTSDIAKTSIVNLDGSLNWNETSGKKTYTFGDGTSITTQWAPVVQYALNKLGISSSSKEAVTAVVNLVEAEGMAGRYDDNNIIKIVNELATAKANPYVTELEYQNMVMKAISNGWITQSDADDLDLWNVDTKQFQKTPVYSSVKTAVEGKVKAKYGIRGQQKEKNSAMVDQIMQEIERAYNADPSAFTLGSSSYEKIIDDAFKLVAENSLDKQLKEAVNTFLYGGLRTVGRQVAGLFNSDYNLPASERGNVSEIVRGLYDPEDPNYGRYHFMTDGIQEGVNKLIDFDTVQDVDNLLNNAAAVYGKGKKFKDLTTTEQDNVRLSVLRCMYEKDVKDAVATGFGVEKNNLIKKYIYGVGVMYVDKTTGIYYATDGNPNTTSMYFTGQLTDSQMSRTDFELKELQAQSIEKRIDRIGGRLLSGDRMTTAEIYQARQGR